MKKVCAVFCALSSGLFLASAFAGQNNFVRWERIVGVITAPNVDNPVGSIHSGTFPWSAQSGTGSEAVFDTPKTVLNAHGDAQFTGHLGQVSASCGSPVFLIRIVSPAGASGLWIATGANP